MKNETLREVLQQIKKYDLTSTFKNEDNLKKWLLQLTSKQINNFLSLNVSPKEIKFPLIMLIDMNMLNCEDYNKKIEALSKLKNGDGCWHLFEKLLNPKFIKSERYYQDIEVLSKADTARYALWILGEDSFIDSPYHEEDLKLVVETHDTKKEKNLNYIVSDALATVAGNINSIKSPYHQADMELISKCGSDSLQMSHSYPERSINYLAIDEVSLNDPYHLENMKILATNPISSVYLYKIMVDSIIVKGEHYRDEVQALVNAKSEYSARAIYNYIKNPDKRYNRDLAFESYSELDTIRFLNIVDANNIAGRETPNYVENLSLLNEIPTKYAMHYVSILTNSKILESGFLNYDLNLLRKTNDLELFMDMYNFITDETSLIYPFHKQDIELLSKVTDKKIRELLLWKMLDEKSFVSKNRDFDLKYICKLNLKNINNEIHEQIEHFLFVKDGIDAENHVEALNMLYKGIAVKKYDEVLNYIEVLEKELDEIGNSLFKKPKSLKLLKKHGNK